MGLSLFWWTIGCMGASEKGRVWRPAGAMHAAPGAYAPSAAAATSPAVTARRKPS
jgi:hypothetical protein